MQTQSDIFSIFVFRINSMPHMPQPVKEQMIDKGYEMMERLNKLYGLLINDLNRYNAEAIRRGNAIVHIHQGNFVINRLDTKHKPHFPFTSEGLKILKGRGETNFRNATEYENLIIEFRNLYKLLDIGLMITLGCAADIPDMLEY